MTLTAEEFLRRFLQHVLPKGFVRIRFSASSQQGGVESCCRFVRNCWKATHRAAGRLDRSRRLKPQPPGRVQAAALRWSSSKGSTPANSACRSTLTPPNRTRPSLTPACRLARLGQLRLAPRSERRSRRNPRQTTPLRSLATTAKTVIHLLCPSCQLQIPLPRPKNTIQIPYLRPKWPASAPPAASF